MICKCYILFHLQCTNPPELGLLCGNNPDLQLRRLEVDGQNGRQATYCSLWGLKKVHKRSQNKRTQHNKGYWFHRWCRRMNVYLYCLVKGPIQFLLHLFLQEACGLCLFHARSSGLEATVVACRITFIDLRPQLLIHANHNHTWQVRARHNINKVRYITRTFRNRPEWLTAILFLQGMLYVHLIS